MLDQIPFCFFCSSMFRFVLYNTSQVFLYLHSLYLLSDVKTQMYSEDCVTVMRERILCGNACSFDAMIKFILGKSDTKMPGASFNPLLTSYHVTWQTLRNGETFINREIFIFLLRSFTVPFSTICSYPIGLQTI